MSRNSVYPIRSILEVGETKEYKYHVPVEQQHPASTGCLPLRVVTLSRSFGLVGASLASSGMKQSIRELPGISESLHGNSWELSGTLRNLAGWGSIRNANGSSALAKPAAFS